MPQLVPAALVAPTRPGLTDVGYLVRSAANYATIITNWTAVAEAGSNTGYYPVLSTISVPDAGCIIEWRRASNSGTFLSAVTVEPVPSNFTEMAITAGGAVTAGTVSDKTGYSLSSTQSFNLTGNITGDLSGSVGSVTGAVGSVTSPVTAGTVSDKTGYSLSSSQTFDLTGNVTGNLSGSVGSVTGAVGSVTNPVTVGTNNDKTGYSLTQAFPTNFPDLAITASTGQVTVGTLANNAITAAAIATDAIDADAIAASAVTEIQAGLATQASVNSIPTTPAPTAAQNAAATWTYTTGDRLLTGSQATEIAKIQGIRDKTDALPSDPADQSLLIDAINTRASQASVNAIPTTPLLAANYTAPDNSGIAAIKAKTDALPSDPADQSELVTLINAIPTTAAPTAAQNATQVRTELTAELARIDATISSRLASSGYTTPPTTGQIRTELATELARIDVATSTRLAAADYTAPPTAAQNATQVRTELGTELARIDTSISSRSTLTAAQIRAELATELGRLDVAVSTRLATAGYTTPPTTAQIATAVEAALLNDADGQALLAAIQTAVQALFDQQADIPVATLVSLIAAQITTDHGSGSYTTANTAALALETSVQAIKTKTDAIPANPLLTTDARLNNLDAAISSRASQTSVSAIPTTPLLAANYTAPDNSGIAAIKAKTDNLPSDPADQSDLVTLINTRASQASVNAIPTTPAPTAAQNASQVRTELGTELARLDVAVSSRSTLTAGDIPAGLSAQQVWEYATRQLTGTQASNLAAIPNIPTNPLLASAYTPPPSAATIADAVWDETLSQHLTAGSTGAKLNLASTLTVGDIPAGLSAQQVWEYATRTLSVASGLTNAQEIKLNELHSKAGLNPAAPVTRTLNPATGNVAETFTGVAINHVETGTTVVTTRQP